MPTYCYECKACGHEWEAEQGIREEPLKVCPECKAEQAKRQIPARTGFVLNGRGWARDGYK